MRKLPLLVSLIVGMAFPIGAFAGNTDVRGQEGMPNLKNINLDVQLKDNGWIKILSENTYILTPEEFERIYLENKDESSIAKSAEHRRFAAQTFGHDENYRVIFVKIQFLNYCKASVDKEEVEKYQKEMDRIDNILPTIPQNQREKTAADYDMLGMIMANVPKFRCNYRTTLMTSFYSSSGEEIETKKNIPVAPWISDKKRKEDMIPGETMTISNVIPDKARYWYVWVPK